MGGRAAIEGSGVGPVDPGSEAVGVVVEGLGDEDPLADDHVAVAPRVRAGQCSEVWEELVGQAEADAALAPDHREDGAAGQEGVASEHAANGDVGEVGGEVVQPGAELEEEGAHERAGGGVYRAGGACLG